MCVTPIRSSVMTLAVWLCTGLAPADASNPPAAQGAHAPKAAPAAAVSATAAQPPAVTGKHAAEKPAAASHAAKGAEVAITEVANKSAPTRPGSIAAAHAAVQRAVASMQGGEPTDKPAAGAAQGPAVAVRPSAKARVAAGQTSPSAAQVPRGPSVVLRWIEEPAGTRQLAWDFDIDPRGTGGGVRLVWKPDVP